MKGSLPYTRFLTFLFCRARKSRVECVERRQVRRTRAVVSPAKIHRKGGGQIVNFTFFLEVSFSDEIPTIFKSIFAIPQICYADFVSDRKDVFLREIGFFFFREMFFTSLSRDWLHFWMIISINISCFVWIRWNSEEIELALTGNEEKRNFTTAKQPLLELLAAKKEKTGRKTWYTRREAEELFCSPSKRRVMPGELAE